MSTKIGMKRLLVLADFLDELKPERFNLRSWQAIGFSVRSCGTTACAVGWATTMPVFKKQGLSSDSGLPMFRSLPGWKAVRAFFGIDTRTATRLFSHQSYPRFDDTEPVEVAKRIRRSVASMKARAA